MNVTEAQELISGLRKHIEEVLNDFHANTGLIADVFVYHNDVTEFGRTRRQVIHNVEITASLKDGSS